MACGDCRRNCESIPCKEKDSSPVVNRFFKIIVAISYLETLYLPPMFARSVIDLVDQKIELEDSSGKQWTVTLSCHNGSLAFLRGWNKFSVDHRLRVKDLLLFNYIKRGKFVVQIFGPSGCERISLDTKGLTVERSRTSSNKVIQDHIQTSDANVINSKEYGRQVKRAKTSSKIAAEAIQYQTIDTNAINFGENDQSVKSDKTVRNIAAEDTPCQTDDNCAAKNQNPITSLQALSNLENIQIQPKTKNDSLDTKGGNGEELFFDNAFYLMTEKDAGSVEFEHRTCLLDLSCFEMQNTEFSAGKNKKGANDEEGTSNHAQKSVRSQAEAHLIDKNATETSVLDVASASESTDIGMAENRKDSGPTVDMSIECEKVHSGDTSSVKFADYFRKDDDISNVFIPLQNAERSSGNSSNDWNTTVDNEDGIRSGELPDMECTGDAIKMAKKEKVEMREQVHDHAKKQGGLEQSTLKERGISSRSAVKHKDVEMDQSDSLDKTTSNAPSITCLALSDAREFLELPYPLPLIKFRKGRPEKKRSVLLQDRDGKMWPAMYCEKSGFPFLTTGLQKINEANGIQPGDKYIISIGDISQCTFKLEVGRK